jgi:hypothetical protein
MLGYYHTTQLGISRVFNNRSHTRIVIHHISTHNKHRGLGRTVFILYYIIRIQDE